MCRTFWAIEFWSTLFCIQWTLFCYSRVGYVVNRKQPRLSVLSYDNLSITHLNFSDNFEFLKVGSRSSFWDLKIPLSQQFLRLAELNLDFHAQINEKYINTKLLHFPTWKILRVYEVVYLNTKLICGILESNPIVAAFSIYTMEPYEILEPFYWNMSHVKLLDI